MATYPDTQALAPRTQTTQRPWHCRYCFKLLGKHDGRFLFVRSSSGHSYSSCLPATAVCRCCGRLNELRSNAR